MSRLKYIVLLLLLCTLNAAAQNVVSYKPGEKIFYDIKYGVLTGGVASLETMSEILYDKEVWHTRMIGKTTGLTDAIYRVLDIYESYIDPKTELPVKSIRNIREGRYRKYNEVLFDHKTRPDSAILTSDLSGIHITQPGIQDILSCFYYFRNNILPNEKNLVKGEYTTIMTWFADELYPIRLKYIGTDEVKTKLGKIRCYKFNPVTEKGRLFSTEEGVSFWFSADKNFLPVKIRFDIFVGSFTVELTSVEGLVYPLEIKKK
jgi:hypothetical protein